MCLPAASWLWSVTLAVGSSEASVSISPLPEAFPSVPQSCDATDFSLISRCRSLWRLGGIR